MGEGFRLFDERLPVIEPPEILYHGTEEKYVVSINAQGLLPRSRLYVHLSGDAEPARKVGSRHGKPVVYEVRDHVLPLGERRVAG